MNSFKETAHELYKKYVETGSAFEINISSRKRQKLKKQMGDKKVWMNVRILEDELMCIFDDTMRDNIELLKQSKNRLDMKLEKLSANSP